MDGQIDLIEDLQFPATTNGECLCNIAQLGDHRSFESGSSLNRGLLGLHTKIS